MNTVSWSQRIALLLIRGYQLLFSSFMGRSCRYYPTCSSYTSTSIRRFGVLKGSWMAGCRICRCHPFHPGGYDPVPEKFSFFSKKSGCCDKHTASPSTERPEIS